jgi:16S rRNA (adenine1518-N6/adenine1519-N6)-dimethyltransferase
VSAPLVLGRTTVRRLLADNGLEPSRALGQNFVVDPNTTERIARLAEVGPGDLVVEIGAGLGALTGALARTGARVIAIEVDRGLAALLPSLVPEGVRVVEADALRLDWASLLADEGGGARQAVLVANLPYNIATMLVLRILEQVPEITRMLVMVQREVAERIAASPGGKEYGGVSARIQYFATARVVSRIPPDVFHPRPHVESALVSIVRGETPAVPPELASYDEIVTLVRAGFAGRRKMLRRSLSGLVDERAFEAAGVAPTARAEELEVRVWGKLAACQRAITSEPSPS